MYGYSLGVGSARALERMQSHEPGLRWLCADQVVNHHSLSDFRVAEQEGLNKLFSQVLAAIEQGGLIDLRTVAHDGTKIRAVSGTGSYRRRPKLEESLKAAEEVVEKLKGEAEAIESLYPKTLVQLCIVHLVRNSLRYVNWKERKRVASALRAIYNAPTEVEAERQLAILEEEWGVKYAVIGQLWRRHWERVRPLFEFPAPLRKVIYTTNAVESLNMTLRKVIKTRGSFPSEEAALKLLYLALWNVARKWQHIQGWREALSHFTLLWGERIEEALARGR